MWHTFEFDVHPPTPDFPTSIEYVLSGNAFSVLQTESGRLESVAACQFEAVERIVQNIDPVGTVTRDIYTSMFSQEIYEEADFAEDVPATAYYAVIDTESGETLFNIVNTAREFESSDTPEPQRKLLLQSVGGYREESKALAKSRLNSWIDTGDATLLRKI